VTFLGPGKRSAKERSSEKPDRDTETTGTADDTVADTENETAVESAERRAAEAREKARRAAELAELAEQAAKEAAEAAAALDAEKAAKQEAEEEPEAAEETEAKAEEEPEAEETGPVVSGAAAKPDLTKPAPDETEPKAKSEDETDAETDAEADKDEGEDEDGEKAVPAEGAGKKRRRVRVGMPAGGSRSLVVLGLVAVLAAGGVGWLWTKKAELDATEAATRQAAYAATQAAQSISSYDYRTVDSDMRKATAYATGDFRKQFETQAERVRTLAPQQQAMVTGTAVKTAVEDISPESGTVLVFLNQQTVKNSEKGEAQRLPSQFTLRMAMTKVGERWLVSKVEVL
jgi:Mce-associated membrane protein